MFKPLGASLLTALVAATSTADAAPTKSISLSEVDANVIGVCDFYAPLQQDFLPTHLSPIGALLLYIQNHRGGQLIAESSDFSFKFTTQPKHGVIREVMEDGGVVYRYTQEKGYVGRDGYAAEVLLKGRKFIISGVILQKNGDGFDYEAACRAFKLPGATWKISESANPDDVGSIPLHISPNGRHSGPVGCA